MKFRPCIDIHDGKVKQIVGSTLESSCNLQGPKENYVSPYLPSYYAKLYKEKNLTGGHVIMLGSSEANQRSALDALKAWPGGMQIGGGINNKNASFYLENGASHVIVTSYIFSNGIINIDNLNALIATCPKNRIVLDLSCKLTDKGYFIATDRWQKLTSEKVTEKLLSDLSEYCDEFLVHAVSKEGLKAGIDHDLVEILASSPIPVTYAGGVSSLDDINLIRKHGKDKVDYTIGSALDIFGGYIPLEDIT